MEPKSYVTQHLCFLEVDDPDGVQGGDRGDADEANFEGEDALPGGAGDAANLVDEARLNPDFDYKPAWSVAEDEMDDVVHRTEETKRHLASKQKTGKQELLQTFMQDHRRAYAAARTPRAPLRCSPLVHQCSAQEAKGARERQEQLLKERKALDTGLEPQPAPSFRCLLPTEAQSRPLQTDELPRSPLDVAVELIARSGVWRSREQYLATLFVLQPVQQLWERASRAGTLHDLTTREGLAELTRGVASRRLFLHGPGGSGKTYCMTEVVLKVIRQFFGLQGAKAIAAANSAARLLGGKTMHAAGKMTRQQSLKAKDLRPRIRAKKALATEWDYLLLLLGDELSLASPPLLSGVSRRASHGRKDLMRLDMNRILEQPFGEVLLQVLMGDFMQLNPVASHTLLEAFLRKSRVPGVPWKISEEDHDGYKVFRKICENVVLFTGTHRFLDKDLPQLLEIMRKKGGALVPPELRARIRNRIQAGEGDPRLRPDYVQEGVKGFFAFGARAAIQWEQVARLQQLRVLAAAKVCVGPTATQNDLSGKPDDARHGFSKAAQGTQGQLVYYFQSVDRFSHGQVRERYLDALRFMNLSKRAGLLGMLGVFVGMRVRLTKKVLPPELVQEATGEVVGISCHPKERFGDPASSHLRPGDAHECWQRGWVKCDYLPLHIEVRWDGCEQDYTGTGRPGVWFLEPFTDTWKLPVATLLTVDHPNAARAKKVKATSRKQKTVDVTSTQVPLAPELVVTFQNIQGQTVRGPEGQPKGFVLDMFRPQTMRGEEREPEYFQHLYMSLGRARKLDGLLLRNFPRDAEGELDWSISEAGPPDFLLEFMEALEKLAAKTLPRLVRAQRELGVPRWEDVPMCAEDPENKCKFLYDPAAWGRQAVKSFSETPRKRLRGKSDAPSPATLAGANVPSASPAGSPSPAKRRRCDKMATPSPPALAKQSSPSPRPGDRSAAAATGLVSGGPRGARAVGWACSLLGTGRRIGVPILAPLWFNDPRCGAINESTGTQRGLTCGLFAVNHCLCRKGLGLIQHRRFAEVAGDGCYPEGDFDDAGLQRNLELRGCSLEILQGADHEDATRLVSASGTLALFNGDRALGCIIHMPAPRHWVALVPPVRQESVHVAALLCDSLYPHIFALSVDEVTELFALMAASHMAAAESQLPSLQQEELAAAWCAYRVTH